MNKTHYEKVAALLAGELALARTSACPAQTQRVVTNIAYSLADIFASDNRLFDRDRFYQSIGMTPPP